MKRNIYSCRKNKIFFHIFIIVRDFCARRRCPVADGVITRIGNIKQKKKRSYFCFGAMKIDMCQMIPSGAPRR